MLYFKNVGGLLWMVAIFGLLGLIRAFDDHLPMSYSTTENLTSSDATLETNSGEDGDTLVVDPQEEQVNYADEEELGLPRDEIIVGWKPSTRASSTIEALTSARITVSTTEATLANSTGSCYVRFKYGGHLQNCTTEAEQKFNIRIVGVPQDGSFIDPKDYGLYCSAWFDVFRCNINRSCNACPDEGPVVEFFLKRDIATLFLKGSCVGSHIQYRQYLETQQCFKPVHHSRTGLIITVVFLSLLLFGQCYCICSLLGKPEPLPQTNAAAVVIPQAQAPPLPHQLAPAQAKKNGPGLRKKSEKYNVKKSTSKNKKNKNQSSKSLSAATTAAAGAGSVIASMPSASK